jgi:L-histidine N-alpha-methyltransferase
MTALETTTPVIARHLTGDDLARALADDVRRGLTSDPKTLPPKYFYDSRGSRLFEQITQLPEYYPTRAERAILTAHAEQIAKLADADTLIELGSGASEKTRVLLNSMRATNTVRRYVPVDVSHSALVDAVESLHTDYPALEIYGLVADLEHQLHLLPQTYGPGGGTRLVAFLGGTIGNLTPTQRYRFLRALAAVLAPDDSLLLGVDLVKQPVRLVEANDDASGVTAAFNRNALHVINHELDADFTPEMFAHVAVWDADREWIEMRLRARRTHTVDLRALDLAVPFIAGEHVRTEISAKFHRHGLGAELVRAGLTPTGWWTDPDGDFALSLARLQL